MEYSFTCCGHENITARHKTTLEFTKEADLSVKGDCIMGIKADFDLLQLKKFIISIGNNRKITILIETMNNNFNNKKNIDKTKINNYCKIIEKINAEINSNFNSDREMVIRKSDFIDGRTFAIKADRAAFGMDRGLAGFLKEKENRIRVTVGNRQ